jgi:hypothetical protein
MTYHPAAAVRARRAGRANLAAGNFPALLSPYVSGVPGGREPPLPTRATYPSIIQNQSAAWC